METIWVDAAVCILAVEVVVVVVVVVVVKVVFLSPSLLFTGILGLEVYWVRRKGSFSSRYEW